MAAKFKKRAKTPKYRNRKNDPVRAKKHLGQHFLTSHEIASQIADTLSYSGYEHLLEIGPGTGILSQFLIRKPVNLLALDVDKESVRYLNTVFTASHLQNVGEDKKVEILHGDFLKFDVLSYYNGLPFGIIGNFPYNISSQILFRVLELREYIPEFGGMFQKEVAQRICAKEGNKTYGILSVLTQAFYNTRYCFTVPPEVFNPPPKVESGVIHLRRKDNFRLSCDESLLFRVVKTSFNQRRKTLRNSLKAFELSNYLKEDAIFDRRPEELAVADFISLTEKIENDTV